MKKPYWYKYISTWAKFAIRTFAVCNDRAMVEMILYIASGLLEDKKKMTSERFDCKTRSFFNLLTEYDISRWRIMYHLNDIVDVPSGAGIDCFGLSFEQLENSVVFVCGVIIDKEEEDRILFRNRMNGINDKVYAIIHGDK